MKNGSFSGFTLLAEVFSQKQGRGDRAGDRAGEKLG